MTVIDCVNSPPVDAMRAAGVTGLCRYLSWTDQRDTLGKVIHQPEFDALHAAKLDITLNWEYAATDYRGGAMAGATHAREAIRQAQALGYPAGCAIIGSADADVTRADWLGTGRAYYTAFSASLRIAGYRAGIYGPWDVLQWARDDGVADVYWQAGMSTAWSGGRNAQLWPGAHLRQRRQATIGGFDCDINDVIQANYGQYRGDDMSAQAENILWAAAVGMPTFRADDGREYPNVLWQWEVARAKREAAVAAALAADEVRDKAMAVTVDGLVAGIKAAGGSIDAAPIVAAVTAVRDEARAQFAALHAENADLKSQLAAAQAREAAAAKAAADALATPTT